MSTYFALCVGVLHRFTSRHLLIGCPPPPSPYAVLAGCGGGVGGGYYSVIVANESTATKCTCIVLFCVYIHIEAMNLQHELLLP